VIGYVFLPCFRVLLPHKATTPYKVQKGDTLYGIARKFQITPEELYAANPRKQNHTILSIGDILHIPVRRIHSTSDPNAIRALARENHVKNIYTPFLYPLGKKVPVQRRYSDLSYEPHKGILFQKTDFYQSVLAAKEGIIVCIDYMEGYGNYIIIKHPGEFYTVYGNLGRIYVNLGQSVPSRHKIGLIKPNSGLYFQITYKDKPLDPASLLI